MEKFNWNSEQWETASKEFLKLVKNASLEWDKKTPIPTGVDENDILSLFKEDIPENGKNLQELVGIFFSFCIESKYKYKPNLSSSFCDRNANTRLV